MQGSVSVGGTVAFVPQNPWVQQATIKDNILFGRKFDQQRYDEALYASALKQDLKALASGDMTEIGERGINISGGQKQRIAIARAIYANADVYLLDSPLSAVDQHTCTHLFREGLKKALKGKTIVLITHQTEILRQCDSVAIMRDCSLIYHGAYSDKVFYKHFPNLDADTGKPSVMQQRRDRIQMAALSHSRTPDFLLDLEEALPLDRSENSEETNEMGTYDYSHSLSYSAGDDVSVYATYMSTVFKTRTQARPDLKKGEVKSPFRVYLAKGACFHLSKTHH